MGTEPDVRYADAALLVIDKPAGLLAVPGRGADKQDCLSERVRRRYPDALVVHRLDMATSGLMLMARGKAAQQALSRAFAARAVHKSYQALVHGAPGDAAGAWQTIALPIHLDWEQRPRRCISLEHGKPSTTRWRVLGAVAPGLCRVELEPVTGRSHQLRVHMLAIGHPILGDTLYGSGESGPATGRLMLHATRIALAHPLSGAPLRLDSPPAF